LLIKRINDDGTVNAVEPSCKHGRSLYSAFDCIACEEEGSADHEAKRAAQPAPASTPDEEAGWTVCTTGDSDSSRVILTIGVQSFQVGREFDTYDDGISPLEQAAWLAKQLRIAMGRASSRTPRVDVDAVRVLTRWVGDQSVDELPEDVQEAWSACDDMLKAQGVECVGDATPERAQSGKESGAQ